MVMMMYQHSTVVNAIPVVNFTFLNKYHLIMIYHAQQKYKETQINPVKDINQKNSFEKRLNLSVG